jgi:hypothetical protein
MHYWNCTWVALLVCLLVDSVVVTEGVRRLRITGYVHVLRSKPQLHIAKHAQ